MLFDFTFFKLIQDKKEQKKPSGYKFQKEYEKYFTQCKGDNSRYNNINSKNGNNSPFKYML